MSEQRQWVDNNEHEVMFALCIIILFAHAAKTSIGCGSVKKKARKRASSNPMVFIS